LTIVVVIDNYMPVARTPRANAGQVLDALADPTRRTVVQLLGDGPQRAGTLAARAGTSPPTMSRHLRVLLRAGVISDARPSDDARARVFSLRPESLAAVEAWLDQIKAHWDEQLGAYRRYAQTRSTR
jgi:DNA-binding transcriptional ArsR family regulator